MSDKFYENKEKRIQWIDELKGYAIISVIFYHSNLASELPLISQWITSFHMALFYVLSGYCYNETKYKGKFYEFVITKVRALIIPFLGFSVLYSFWGILSSDISTIFEFIECVCNGSTSAVWFLLSLFWIELITWLLFEFNLNLRQRFIVVSVLLCVVFYLITMRIGMWFRIEQSLLGLFYFSLGTMCKELKLFQNKNKSKNVLVGFSSLILGSIAAFTNGEVIYSRMQFGKHTCVGALVIPSLISLGLMLLFSNAKSSKVSFYGRNTLIILCTHQLVLAIFQKMIFNALGNSLLSEIVAFLIVFLVQIPIIYAWNTVKKIIKNFCESHTIVNLQ